MKNLFENAYFGKPYKTRDGKKALLLAIHPSNVSPYIEDAHIELLIDNYPKSPIFTTCNSLGQCTNPNYAKENIVSEWEEEINEEELNKLAETEANNTVGEWRYGSTDLAKWYSFKDGFKAGCHKVMEYLANNKKNESSC